MTNDNVFTIRTLDSGWDWLDIYSDSDIELYCLEELEVPEEHIEAVKCLNRAFQLTLKREHSYHNDDWYVNLQRSA